MSVTGMTRALLLWERKASSTWSLHFGIGRPTHSDVFGLCRVWEMVMKYLINCIEPGKHLCFPFWVKFVQLGRGKRLRVEKVKRKTSPKWQVCVYAQRSLYLHLLNIPQINAAGIGRVYGFWVRLSGCQWCMEVHKINKHFFFTQSLPSYACEKEIMSND